MLRRILLLVLILIPAALALYLFTGQQSSTSNKTVSPPKRNTSVPSSLYMKMKMVLGQPGGRKTTDYQELWWKSPSNLRTDMGSGKNKLIHILTKNSETMYYADTGYALITPSTMDVKATARKIQSKVSLSTSDTLKEIGPKAKVTGKDTVAGMQCDVIEWADRDTHTRMCVDNKTGVMLQTTQKTGNRLIYDMVVTGIETGKPISESVFQPASFKAKIVRSPIFTRILNDAFLSTQSPFTPNAGVTFETLREPSGVTGDLRRIMDKDRDFNRKREIKAFYIPRYVPTRMRLALAAVVQPQIRKETASGTTISYDNDRYNAIEIDYVDPKTGDAMVLHESSKKIKPKGKPVSINGIRGHVFAASEPYPYTILYWNQDGVYFELGGVNVSESELIKIAGSVKRL